MATWVVGDIHGQYKALQQVLERSGFTAARDTLICLGDLVDRGPRPFECIFALHELPNLVCIRGNHDENFLYFIRTGTDRFMGRNGVRATIDLWMTLAPSDKVRVESFFGQQQPWYKNAGGQVFTHGGFDRHKLLEDQDEDIFAWDRKLWEQAVSSGSAPLRFAEPCTRVFIGHTPTLNFEGNAPMLRGGIWNLDTGAAYRGGKLTMMNIETEEYVQSDEI
ncbi:metallophosphoesterase family protein [Flaviaesturariibacter amylovorans]|uniref:Metallophosphoesterase family protein n=1 Tax=Flaviaesturariibacter amylovorans TaxID=1084520 RepID=A0ABP8HUK9_9BACT